MKLRVTISKAANSNSDYMQILSDDQLSTNIVLVADSIELNDRRPKKR